MGKLHDITALEETAVLAQAKAVFAQQQWTVQGNIYQAGGDIHIHNESSASSTAARAKPLVEQRRTMVAIMGLILASIATGFYLFGLQGADTNLEGKPPFHIELRSVSLHARNTLVHVRDNTASPINFALYLQVLNIQEVLSQIQSYTVQVAQKVDGPWKTLMPISARDGKLCFISDGDLSHAAMVELNNDLVKALDAQAFNPHETKSGWVFSQRHDLVLSKIKFFRFHIRDTAGAVAVQIVPLLKGGAKGELSFSMGGFIYSGRQDISSSRFKYAYSSYPD